MAVISATNAPQPSTRVCLKADPTKRGTITASHLGGVTTLQQFGMEPPLLLEGTKFSIDFDSTGGEEPRQVGNMATREDLAEAEELDGMHPFEELSRGQLVLVHRSDGRWTYGRVLPLPDDEDGGQGKGGRGRVACGLGMRGRLGFWLSGAVGVFRMPWSGLECGCHMAARSEVTRFVSGCRSV